MSENSDQLIHILKLNPNEIVNIYLYGSRVYGTFNQKSDWDYTIIMKGSSYNQKNTLKYDNFDVNFYNEKEFESLILEHSINALEYIFLPLKFVPVSKKDFRKDFKLDKQKLVSSVNKVVNETMKSAETHWNLNKFHLAKKKIFHSIRFVLFGIQILKKNEIYDYEEANGYFKELMKEKFNSFDETKEKYLKILKKLLGELKSISNSQ
jgi:predicted nucleotidyltransferase